MIVCAENISLQHQPHNTFGKGQLISFFCGSDVAFVVAIDTYICWTLLVESVQVSLLFAKTRVTALQIIFTLPLELNGAVIATCVVSVTLRKLFSYSFNS